MSVSSISLQSELPGPGLHGKSPLGLEPSLGSDSAMGLKPPLSEALRSEPALPESPTSQRSVASDWDLASDSSRVSLGTTLNDGVPWFAMCCNSCDKRLDTTVVVASCSCIFCAVCGTHQGKNDLTQVKISEAESDPYEIFQSLMTKSSNADPDEAITFKDMIEALMLEHDALVANTQIFVKQFARETEKSKNQLRIVEERAESYSMQLTELKNVISGLERQREDCLKQMQEKDIQIHDLKHDNGKNEDFLKEMLDKDRTIQDLKDRHEGYVLQKDRQIVDLEKKREECLKQLGEKEREITRLMKKLQEKDRHALDLNREKEAMKHTRKKNFEHEEASKQIQEKDRQIVCLNRQHEEACNALQERDRDIQRLKSMLHQFVKHDSQPEEIEPRQRNRRSASNVLTMTGSIRPMGPPPTIRQRSNGSSSDIRLYRRRSSGSAKSAPDVRISRAAPNLRRVRSTESSMPATEYRGPLRPSSDPAYNMSRQRSNDPALGVPHHRRSPSSQPPIFIPHMQQTTYKKRRPRSNEDPSFGAPHERSTEFFPQELTNARLKKHRMV